MGMRLGMHSATSLKASNAVGTGAVAVSAQGVEASAAGAIAASPLVKAAWLAGLCCHGDWPKAGALSHQYKAQNKTKHTRIAAGL